LFWEYRLLFSSILLGLQTHWDCWVFSKCFYFIILLYKVYENWFPTELNCLGCWVQVPKNFKKRVDYKYCHSLHVVNWEYLRFTHFKQITIKNVSLIQNLNQQTRLLVFHLPAVWHFLSSVVAPSFWSAGPYWTLYECDTSDPLHGTLAFH